MKLQIDPIPQLVVALTFASIHAAAKGTIALPLGVPPVWGEYITSWSRFLLEVYVMVIAPALISLSSNRPGPLAK